MKAAHWFPSQVIVLHCPGARLADVGAHAGGVLLADSRMLLFPTNTALTWPPYTTLPPTP